MSRNVLGTRAERAVIKCLVGDDHEVLRLGLVRALSSDENIEVVGQAADGEAALALIERRRPDVAVLDLHMPGAGGLEICRRLAEAGSEVAVLVYTGDADVALVDQALAAGARGFAVKSGPMSELARAVRLVAAGETYVESTLVTGLLSHRERPGRPVLSPREAEVLEALAGGLTTEATGEALFLSPATVRSYAETAMQKLGARNRTHAVALAVREGLIG